MYVDLNCFSSFLMASAVFRFIILFITMKQTGEPAFFFYFSVGEFRLMYASSSKVLNHLWGQSSRICFGKKGMNRERKFHDCASTERCQCFIL